MAGMTNPEALAKRLDDIGEEEMYQAPASTKATLDEAAALLRSQAAEVAALREDQALERGVGQQQLNRLQAALGGLVRHCERYMPGKHWKVGIPELDNAYAALTDKEAAR